MRIKITAGGIYGADGKEIEVGTVVTTTKEPKAWAGRYEVVSGDAETFEAKAKGDKWFIVNGKGKNVGKELSEADAAAFNALSDEEKAEFAAEHGKA